MTDADILRRSSLKAQHPSWKEKLRQNCLRRGREDRTNLLWKVRSPGGQALSQKEDVESALRGIVSNELQKIKQLSLSNHNGNPTFDSNDVLWEYDGLQMDCHSTGNDREELLIEMERLLYEDLREELIRRELDAYEEEDKYLAEAVFEHMQLNNEAVRKEKVWCPICKRGELHENWHLIYCTCCKLRLDLESDKVNLDFLRSRLAEVHEEHFEKGCKAAPVFSMETNFNLAALYIKCETCGTFEIVI